MQKRRTRVRERQYNVIPLLIAWAAIYLMALGTALGQTFSPEDDSVNHPAPSTPTVCEQVAAPAPLKDALRPLCSRKRAPIADPTIRKTIIIGFVGGFVKRDDPKHPEVQFAAYLRDHYPPGIHAEVFSNHESHKALSQVLRLLDTDRDGALTAAEKQQARIIIYGHSWGASQTVAFARQLGKENIPVLLTIQVDSIAKPGQKDSTIPPNVASAVNFYQPGGLLHGRSRILAADPGRTKIIGNYQMTYQGHPINCTNYPWLARTFNKPHHEIENDPRVWDQAASLIDSELSNLRSTPQSSSLSQSPLFK
jgi:hypothetical protein